MQETFYATFAGLSFTLLGLWWVVVEFKHAVWMSDPAMRRMSYNVSLYFSLPGIMSLLSLLSADATLIWRTAFFAAGLFGVVEGLRVALGRYDHASAWVTVGRWLAVALFALICLVAVFPRIVTSVGLQLRPIEVEAVILAVILFLGINTAWHLFAAPLSDAPPAGDR